jgi:HlyD family secretion protein
MSTAAKRPAGARGRRRWAWCLCVVALLGVAASVSTAVALHSAASTQTFETTSVHRGDVMATIEAEGNVESAHNVEITCQVNGGSTILWIVPDGTLVNAGDELVRFDSSAVEDLLSQQTIVLGRATAAQIAAEHELAAARLALSEYVEGTFAELNEEADVAIAQAEHNLTLSQRMLTANKRLMRLGYITPTQLEASEFSVEQAELRLDIARRTKTVLETYNRPKMTQELRSRVETAAAMVRSTTAEHDLAQSQLERYQRQLDACVVRAPHSGLAIHANDSGRSFGESLQIELGALVRQRQTVIWLPDLSTMQVRSLVHESSVTRVRPGQRAAVTVRGHELPAVVTLVANQPAPMRRSQQHLKYFVVLAQIVEPSPGLRPGETADLTILLDYRPDVLCVPLQTIMKEGDGVFVWVADDGELEARRVELGTLGDDGAEVRDGLCGGERLLVNPRDKLPELGFLGNASAESERPPFDSSPDSTAGSRYSAIHTAGG